MTKKRMLSLLLAAVMALTLLPVMAFAEEPVPVQPVAPVTGPGAEAPAGEYVLPAVPQDVEPAAGAGNGSVSAACTKTNGCILAEGHAGECVLPAVPGENGETVQVFAAEPASPADDGVNTPEELEAALAAGGSMTLSGDIEVGAGQGFTIQNAVVLDLNGFAISRSGDSNGKLFTVKNNGSLTLNDSKGTGTVNSTYPVQLYSNATFIMNGGAITSNRGAALDIFSDSVNVKVAINGGSATVAQGNSDNVFGIRGKENVKVDITGGDILGTGGNRLAMYVSGSRDGAIELNISGGSVQSAGQAIQAYSGAVIHVSGSGVIHSETNTAISTQSGYGAVELNVTGGTISTGSSTDYAVYAREKSSVNISGGTITGGTAVMVYDNATVNVTGGMLDGKQAAIRKGSSAAPSISVTGGKFSHDVDEYVPAGMSTEKDADGNFIVKKPAVVYAGGAGASDGNTGAAADSAVATLAKALELVEEGGTIMVCGQLNTNDAVSLENVTLERANGFAGTMLNVSTGTLTLKNVTINGNKDAVQASKFGSLVTLRAGTTLNIGEGAVLKDNGALAVYALQASTVNMTGGVISGNESSVDSGAILSYGGAVNLTGGEITGNSSELAGGGVCFLGAGTVTLDGTKITGNSATRGGGVYIEGLGGDATFVMKSGEITANRLAVCMEDDGSTYLNDGAGICAWYGEHSQNVIIDIQGGVISGNLVTDELAEDPGVGSAISLNGSENPNDYYNPYGHSELRLGGSPVISGDIFLWDAALYDANDDIIGVSTPVVTVAEGFAPSAPLAIDANYRAEGTAVVKFPVGMTAAEAEALFAPVGGRVILAADGQELKWLQLTKVLFKTQDNRKTYKTVYLRPGTTIDPALAPVEGGAEGVAAPADGYALAGWVGYGENELWDFATGLVKDGNMTLLAVWGPAAPTVTLEADKTVVHVEGSFTLTAVPSHPLSDVTYSYAWYKDGQLVDGETNAALVTSEPGSYTVKVTATRGRLTSAAAESSPVVCTVENHTLTKTEAKPATHGTAGHKAYWTCSGCDKLFADENGSVVITAPEVIPPLGHSFGTEWKVDANNHWHECTCGEKADVAAHTYGEWTTTKATTAIEAGSREKSCTVCGYKVTESIPATEAG